MRTHLALLLTFAACACAPQPRAAIVADSAAARLSAIDVLVQEAIDDKRLPGAVVLIGRDDRTLYHKAFGMRSVTPSPEPMTADTIFDLARTGWDMRSSSVTESMTLPVVGAEEGGVSYLVRDDPAATDVLNAFAAGQPLPAS